MQHHRVGNRNLAVEVQGAGTPLLLVHGFPLDHTMWRGQFEGLADRYQLIAPDLAGFGSSSATSGTITMRQYADDLAGLLDALGIEQPVAFCGLSMGGYIGWQFWNYHADRLRCLILCDTRAIADDEVTARGRLKAAEDVVRQGCDMLIEGMIPKLFAETTVRDRDEVVEQTREVIRQADPAGVAAALRGMAERTDMTDQLAKIDLPVLLLGGQHDVISPPDEMRGIAGALPNARFVEISGAGHMAPLEAPQAVNKAIVDFLAQVSR